MAETLYSGANSNGFKEKQIIEEQKQSMIKRETDLDWTVSLSCFMYVGFITEYL